MQKKCEVKSLEEKLKTLEKEVQKESIYIFSNVMQQEPSINEISNENYICLIFWKI